MDFNDDTYRDYLWNKLNENHAFVPTKYLKNIMKYGNFDNINALKRISALEKGFPFKEMKTFVRSRAYADCVKPFIEAGEDPKNFYGLYHKYHEDFEFTPGDKITLDSLFAVVAMDNQRKYRFQSTEGADFDEAYERQTLEEAIANTNFPQSFNIVPSNLEFEVTSSNSAKIKCVSFNCNVKVKIKKQRGGWNMFNYNRHLKNHVTQERRSTNPRGSTNFRGSTNSRGSTNQQNPANLNGTSSSFALENQNRANLSVPNSAPTILSAVIQTVPIGTSLSQVGLDIQGAVNQGTTPNQVV